MKKVILIFCVTLLCSGIVYAQDDRDDLKHSFTVEIQTFLFKTISVSYNYWLNDKYELRINPRISFAFDEDKDNLVAGIRLVQDPFWYYDSYMLQLGISRNFNTFYVEPLLYYKYASFDDRILQITDSDGDSYDVYQELSRQFSGGGIVFRSGLKIDRGHFRFNFFWGLGYYLRYYHEVVTREFSWSSGYVPGDLPKVSDYWKDGFTLHLGIEIGLRFGRSSNEKM